MGLLQGLLALIAGALITLSLSPFDLWPLAWLAPALLFWLLRKQQPKAGFWIGWSFGIGVFGAGISWVFVSISQHSATPIPIAIAMTAALVIALALLFAVQSWLFCKLFSRRAFNWLAFSGMWLLFEWLRSWLFTGFPWLYLGYATLDTPLTHWAPIGGVWLNSLWVVLAGTALIGLFATRLVSERILALVALLAPWLTLSLLPMQWTQIGGNSLQVALLQPNVPQAIKWQPQYLDSILQDYQQLTQQHLDADLIIWPETAIPALYRTSAERLTPLFEQLDASSAALISGMPAAVSDLSQPSGFRIHNSVAVLSNGTGIYHKQRLVPFGEYVPLEQYLRGLIDFFNLPASSFSLPLAEQTPLQVAGTKIAAAICYEIAYPELVRQSSLDADVLLTISNDTWFGTSIAPDQHLQIARMRALETGRWLLRGTNNGITAVIAPDGKVIEQAPRYEQAVLRSEVLPMSGLTAYQQYGQQPVLAFAVLLILFGLTQSRKRISSGFDSQLQL